MFIAFEETREDLVANVASLGFDLAAARGARASSSSTTSTSSPPRWSRPATGISRRCSSASARRSTRSAPSAWSIDTIETLFGAFNDTATLRAELQRLFLWLKDRGVTAVITGERGEGTLTRHGIEEYVSDCVIVLDHLVSEETSTRRLRVLKYRGSLHGTNEYPFLIGEQRHLGAADHLAGPPARTCPTSASPRASTAST